MLLLLGGEAGIGKTRLAQEAAEMAQARGATVVWASAVDGGAPPYWPWVGLLRSCARIVGSDALPRFGPHMADLTNLLPGTLPPPEPNPPWGQSRHLRLHLFDGVATVLHDAARRNPLVIVLDDL